MTQRAWRYWKRVLAMLVAMILILEALPLQTLAAVGRDSYIPLVVSEDEEEEEAEDYSEDAELIDDRPLLAAGISPRALRASGSNATVSNALPLATPYVAFRQSAGTYAPWTGAVEDGALTAANNYVKLDPANSVFQQPSDFVIGKYNSRTFSVQFAFRPSEISDTVRNNLVMELWIPAGLDLSGTPSLTGVSFSSRRLADGSWVLTARPDPTTASVSGQITLVQDPNRLINELPLSQGEFTFRMRLINNYGSTNPAAPPTLFTVDSGDHDKTTALTLNTPATNPTMTFSNPSDSYTFMPGEIGGVWSMSASMPLGKPVGRRMIAYNGYETSAAEDALAPLGTGNLITSSFNINNPTWYRKGLEFKVHKSEGYLAETAKIHMVLPGEGTQFEQGGTLAWTYETDDGFRIPWTRIGAYQDTPTPANRDVVINLRNLYSQYTSGRFAEAVAGSGLSYIDIFRKPGTFHVKYYPLVYYNRLYQGNWGATDYTATAGSYIEYADNTVCGGTKQDSGTPLRFRFIQGTDPVQIKTSNDYLDMTYGGDYYRYNLDAVPQYSATSPEYTDSEEVKSGFRFDDESDAFQIQDNLLISYDFEEALSPVWLNQLGLAPEYGLGYRIYVKDAQTGQTEIRTLVPGELYPSYTAQTINYNGQSITETVIDGTGMTDYTFADANVAGNKKYIARVEVFKKEYDYNQRGSFIYWNIYNAGNNKNWFTFKLRAYHHRLSDGTDIPDNYEAKVQRNVSSDQILAQNGGQPFAREFKVRTRHLTDDIRTQAVGGGTMEVNRHDEINMLGLYRIIKNPQTMDYNVDSTGQAIAFGAAGYDPVVLEISGDAITITEYLEKADLRLLGVWDSSGNYHDLQQAGIDPEQPAYLKDGISRYSDTELSVFSNSNDNGNFGGKVYDLNAVCNALGTPYATRVVMAADQVNSFRTSINAGFRQYSFFAQKVYPGHLNYDNAVGTNGSADLPKQLDFSSMIYCLYSDYKSEQVDHNPPQDSTIHGINPYHGSSKKSSSKSARLVVGDAVKGISVLDQDYYVNPWSLVDKGRLGGNFLEPSKQTFLNRANYIVNVIGQGTYAAGEVAGQRELELTRIAVDNTGVTWSNTAIPEISYENASIDFAGTSPYLLSLVNAISFDIQSPSNFQDFILDATLSDGTVKHIEDTAYYAYTSTGKGRMHYLIPGVDVKNGPYVTSIKVSFPNNKNWGDNREKMEVWSNNNGNRLLPSVGLSLVEQDIPKKYPGTTVSVGSLSEKDSDPNYDKLTVKAQLHYENVLGENMTTDLSRFATEGASERIASQRVDVAFFQNQLSYASSNTYQGRELTVSGQLRFAPTAGTRNLAASKDLRVRPTYYLKIDKSFTYVDNSAKIQGFVPNATGAGMMWSAIGIPDVTFIPAGTGAGQSGHADYGILVISTDQIPENELPVPGQNLAAGWYGYINSLSFKLQADYSADPVYVKPVPGVWLDTKFDANRDGNGGNAKGVEVETTNDNNQLVQDAPRGVQFGNATAAKAGASANEAAMLYAANNTTHKINQVTALGLLALAQANKPYQESSSRVTSRDLNNNPNIFSAKVFLTSDDTNPTNDWEIYIPVPKAGEQYSYLSGGVTQTTPESQFSMDYYGVDTSALTGLNYTISYTTDSNPAANGYTGAKTASWTTTKPADADITMVKLNVSNMPAGRKASITLQYQLHERKKKLLNQMDTIVAYGNFRMGTNPNPFYGADGQASNKLEYLLPDLTLSGIAFQENDFNSLYDAGTDSYLSGVRMKLLEADGVTEVLRSDNNLGFVSATNANGYYMLYVPHEGNWVVQADASSLSPLRKLVKKDQGTNPAVSSRFDRNTNLAAVTVTANVPAGQYNLPHVNAGFYNVPILDLADQVLHAGDAASTVTPTLTNPVDPANPAVNYAIQTGAATDLVSVNGSGALTGSLTPQKTGVTTLLLTTDDGYGELIKKEVKVRVWADVKYDSNGADSGSISANGERLYPSTTAAGADAHTDETTAKSSAGTAGVDTQLTRAGYYFDGWNTKPDGTGTAYAAGAAIKTGKIDGDLTLYAVWRPVTPATDSFNIEKLLKGDYGLLPDGQRAPLTAENFKFTLTGTSFTAANVTAEPMPTGSAKESSRDETPGQNPVVKYTLPSSDLSLITPGSPVLTENATAGATFASGTFNFTMPGTYVYTLKEEAGSAQYYGYNARVYTITYVVTQSGSGLGNALSFTRTISYTDATGSSVNVQTASFENTYQLPRYTVTFDPDQGSFTPPAQTHRYGDRVTEPPVQNNAAGVATSPAGERYGYHFKHWKAADGTQFQFVNSSVRANFTLTAVWEINTYPVQVLDSATADAPHANEVIFDNGGAQMAHGTVLNAPTAPENKTGYHFDHWENDADHSTFSFGNPVTGPLTIRAVYAPNAYTVKYDKNAASASGTTADSAHVYDQTRALTANGYTNPGYYFAGWSRTAGGTTVDLNDGDNVLNLTTQNNGTVTLYAIWQPVNPISDSFDVSKLLFGDFGSLQGGETAPLVPDTFRFVLQSVTTPTGTTTVLPVVPGGGAVSGITVTPGAGTMGYALPSAQLQVPAAGSQAATAGAAAVANFPAGLFTFSFPGTYVYTLKETAGSAQYYSYDPAVYTITFTVTQSAGALGAGTGNSLTVTRTVQKASGGASTAATELQFENRYTLPRLTVQYDAEGGSHTPANESVRYGDYATVPPVQNNAAGTPTSPAGEKTGYHFLYWTDAAGTQFPFGSTPIHANTTLHAKWEINRYTVTVQDAPDADTGHQNNQLAQHSNVAHGDTSLTAPVQPENKTGYHFDHWEDQNNTAYTFGSPVTDDTTVHAVYTPNTYTVRFELNAGGATVNGSMSNLSMTYDTAQNLTPNQFSRPGYQFMGWGLTPTAATPDYYDGASVNNLTTTNGGTVRLYALWTAVTPFDHDPALTKILGGEANRTLATGETTPLAPETFNFEFKAVSTTVPGMSTLPMPAAAHGAQTYTVNRAGAGALQIGSLRFLFAGDYVYELREIAGAAGTPGTPAAAQGSYTYDSAVYRITYHITQAGTVMNGSVTIEKQTAGGAFSAPVAYATATEPKFTNDYLLPRYTVSFNANGGSVTPAPQVIVYGDPVIAPPTVGGSPAGSRTGFDFGGWQNPDGSPANFTTPVTGNLVLSASWTMRHYTVTVLDAPDADPGHQNAVISQDTNAVHGSTPTEPARPDNKTNYVFDHWAKPDGSTYNFDEPLSGDLTVHAVYRQKRYTVHYDSGTPHSVGSMTDSHFGGGDTNPLPPNQYARPGFTFGGWSRTPGATTPDFTDGQPVTNLTTSDGVTVTLYAVWNPASPVVLHDPPVKKVITGAVPHNAGTFTFALRAVSTTAAEAIGQLPMPLAAGGNQEMQLVIAGAGEEEFGDITFRLPGTYVYEISELPIGRRGFSFDSDPVTVTYVVTQTGSVLNATRTMEKRGQAVTEAVFTNEFEKPNYIVTFDGNGAWRPFESQTVREGLTASEPIRKPVRSYGKFIGWYLDGQPYDFSQPVYDDITLFAMYDDSDSDNTSGGSGGGGSRGGSGGGSRGGGGGGGSRGGSSSRGNDRGSHIVPTPSANIATTPAQTGDSGATDKPQNADPNKRAADSKKTEKLDGGSRRKRQTSGDKMRKRRLPKTGEETIEKILFRKEERRDEEV